MIEIAAAALIPAAVALVLSRVPRDRALWRATSRWFVPMTLLWFAPFWMSGSTPAPLSYLRAQVVPWKSGGVAVTNALLSDVVLQFLPWHELVRNAWLHGELPFLNRFAGSGSVLWANPTAQVLAPLAILGLPFSTFAWPLFAATAKVLVSLCGMFMFLREEERSERAAVFGAVAYAFSAFTVAYMLFPLTDVSMLLPWLMLAIRRSRIVPAAVVTALLLLAGHHETVLHVAMIAIPFGLCFGKPARLAYAAIIGFLLAAPVVVPFLFAVRNVERIGRGAAFFASPQFSLPNLLPFFFGAHFHYSQFRTGGGNFNEVATQFAGFATFVLFVVAAWTEPKRHRFWLIAFAILAVSAFNFGPLGLPLLQGRIRFVLAFIMAAVASRALDLEIDRRRIAVAGGVTLAIVLAVVAISWREYVHLRFAAVASGSAAIAAISIVLMMRWRSLLPVALFAELALLGMTSYPPASRADFYPETPALAWLRAQPGPFRIVGIEGALFPNTSAMFGIEDIRVHDPMAFEPYAAMLERAGFDRREYFEMFHRLPPKALADRLGVRYIVAAPGTRGALPVGYAGPDAVVFISPGPHVSQAAAAALPGWEVPRDGRPARFRPPGLTLGIVLCGLGITLLLHAVWLSVITRGSSASAA